jgi:hypothetical protein
MFQKDPTAIGFGRGSATVAYRPVAFDGRITATELVLGLDFGGGGMVAPPIPAVPLGTIPPSCEAGDCDGNNAGGFDQVADVDLFDLGAQSWKRLPRFQIGTRYSVADPARYVDPASGTVLVRFVNDRSQEVRFGADVAITGTIE